MAVAAVVAALIAVLALRPFLRWVTTRYVVTNRRLVTRRGVLARSDRDVPLFRVTDITFAQGPVQRVLGSGTLVVETGGERVEVVLVDIPHVEAVQRRLNELTDDVGSADDSDHFDADDLDPAFGLERAGGPEAS